MTEPAAVDNLTNPLVLVALVCAVLSTCIVVWYLATKPRPTLETKIALLLGVAVFPIGAAMATNVVGFQATQTRQFCSSCHVMLPYTDDGGSKTSTSLASRHGHNELFGGSNCYSCHSDYGMYGTVATKLNGMKHVWIYYTEGKDWPREAFDKIVLYKPYTNHHCTHCHSMDTPYFQAVRDHKGIREDLASDKTSCAGGGCHGPSHPFSKKKEEVKP